jgi:hypothetical protein
LLRADVAREVSAFGWLRRDRRGRHRDFAHGFRLRFTDVNGLTVVDGHPPFTRFSSKGACGQLLPST